MPSSAMTTALIDKQRMKPIYNTDATRAGLNRPQLNLELRARFREAIFLRAVNQALIPGFAA